MAWARRSLQQRRRPPSLYPQQRAAMGKLRPGRLTMEYSDEGDAPSARLSCTGAALGAPDQGADPCSPMGATLLHVVAEGAEEGAAGAGEEPVAAGKAQAHHRLGLAPALAALALDLRQQLAALEAEVPLRQLYGTQPWPQEEQQAGATEGTASSADAQLCGSPHASPGLLGLAGPGRGAARPQLRAPQAWPPPPAHIVARARAASAAARAAAQLAAAPGAQPDGAGRLLLEQAASLRRMSSVLRRLSTVLLPFRAQRASGSAGEGAADQQPPLWRENLAGRGSEAEAGQPGGMRRFSTALRRFSAALLLPRQRHSSNSSSGSTGRSSTAASADPASQLPPTWHDNGAAARPSSVQGAGERATLRRMSSVARRLFGTALPGQQPPVWPGSLADRAAVSPTKGHRPPLGIPPALPDAHHMAQELAGNVVPSMAVPTEPPSWRNNHAASRASMLAAEERTVLRMSSVLRRLSSALLPSWMRLPADSSAGEGSGPATGRHSGLRHEAAPDDNPSS